MYQVGRNLRQWHGGLQSLVDHLVDHGAMHIIHFETVAGQDIRQRGNVLLVAQLGRFHNGGQRNQDAGKHDHDDERAHGHGQHRSLRADAIDSGVLLVNAAQVLALDVSLRAPASWFVLSMRNRIVRASLDLLRRIIQSLSGGGPAMHGQLRGLGCIRCARRGYQSLLFFSFQRFPTPLDTGCKEGTDAINLSPIYIVTGAQVKKCTICERLMEIHVTNVGDKRSWVKSVRVSFFEQCRSHNAWPPHNRPQWRTLHARQQFSFQKEREGEQGYGEDRFMILQPSCLESSFSIRSKSSLRSKGFLRNTIWRCCISLREGAFALIISVGTVSKSLKACRRSWSSKPSMPGI